MDNIPPPHHEHRAGRGHGPPRGWCRSLRASSATCSSTSAIPAHRDRPHPDPRRPRRAARADPRARPRAAGAGGARPVRLRAVRPGLGTALDLGTARRARRARTSPPPGGCSPGGAGWTGTATASGRTATGAPLSLRLLVSRLQPEQRVQMAADRSRSSCARSACGSSWCGWTSAVWIERRSAGDFDIDFSVGEPGPFAQRARLQLVVRRSRQRRGTTAIPARGLAAPAGDREPRRRIAGCGTDFLRRVEENAPAAFLYTQTLRLRGEPPLPRRDHPARSRRGARSGAGPRPDPDLTRWLVRRIAQAVVTFAIAVVLMFVLMRLAPGDPLSRMQEDRPMSPEEIAQPPRDLRARPADPPAVRRVRARRLPRRPRHSRSSTACRSPPSSRRGSPATLLLGGAALLLNFTLGLWLGVRQAVRRGSREDRALTALSLAGYATPSFWLGLVLAWLVGIELGWLPVAGHAGSAALAGRALARARARRRRAPGPSGAHAVAS